MDNVDLEIEKIEEELKKTRKLAKDFKKDLEKARTIKLSESKNKKYVVELKKSLRKMLDYKYNQSNNKDDDLLNLVYFYLDVLDDKTIYNYLPIFDKINFINIKEEKDLLDKIDLPIYINRLTGDIVIMKNKNDIVNLYSSISKSEIEVSLEYFNNNYISLKTYIEKAKYVGNKVVKFKSDEGLDINFPYQDFIYYYDNLILAFEHDEDEKDNFYFYPEANLEVISSVDLRFEGIKPDPVAGLFKNKDYTYQSIVSNFKHKLKDNEVLNSKKR